MSSGVDFFEEEQKQRSQIEVLQTYWHKNFSYTIKEMEAFNDLIKLRNLSGQEYFKAQVDLEARKDKLLMISDPWKWELDDHSMKKASVSLDDITKNPSKAKPFMIPQVKFFHPGNFSC